MERNNYLEIESAFEDLINELQSIKDINEIALKHKNNSDLLIIKLEDFFNNSKKLEIKMSNNIDKSLSEYRNINHSVNTLYKKTSDDLEKTSSKILKDFEVQNNLLIASNKVISNRLNSLPSEIISPLDKKSSEAIDIIKELKREINLKILKDFEEQKKLLLRNNEIISNRLDSLPLEIISPLDEKNSEINKAIENVKNILLENVEKSNKEFRNIKILIGFCFLVIASLLLFIYFK